MITETPHNFHITECGRGYSLQILDILNEAIANTAALYDYEPRTIEMMTKWFDAKEENDFPVVGVVTKDNQLAAFGSYGHFRNWPAYKYTVEHSIYVSKEFRRKGLGKVVLCELLKLAEQNSYHTVIGGIDSKNTASINLHLKCGFTKCGTIRHAGYKFNSWLDLDFYQKLLTTPENPQDG